jgi:hypothetical protein
MMTNKASLQSKSHNAGLIRKEEALQDDMELETRRRWPLLQWTQMSVNRLLDSPRSLIGLDRVFVKSRAVLSIRGSARQWVTV